MTASQHPIYTKRGINGQKYMEAIGGVRRLLSGFEPRGSSLAAELFAEIGHNTDFLGLRHTREWFRRA